MKTYLKIVAYLMYAVGLICVIRGYRVQGEEILIILGIAGGFAFGGLFFFFAKIIEQNEDKSEMQMDIYRMLNRIDDTIRTGGHING